MPLLDLSLVTQTFTTLIRTHVSASDGWNTLNDLNVDPRPPDKLEGENTLGFYLYHVSEEMKAKHAYIPGVSDNPVRFTPMGLHLYYILTAHSDLDGAQSALREQLMMGLAMKALHDNPLITDDTLINGTQVMAPLLRGNDNAFRIAMLPVKPEDAVTYWTAGSSPQRLTAYYHVSIVHLEPDDPAIRAGRVYSYNVFVLPSDSPRIDATENTISFTLPTETDPRTLVLRPAQVTYNQPFSVIGSAFTGDEVVLLLRRADWEQAVAIDPGWSLGYTASRIEATVRDTASGIDIVPGIYAASVRAERTRTTPTTTKVLSSTSNESPFAIVPLIATVSVPDGAGRFSVTGGIFQHPDIAPGMVQVFVGADRLTEGDFTNLQEGEFGVEDAATLHARLPAGFVSEERLSLRIIVNGAETAPRWVTVP